MSPELLTIINRLLVAMNFPRNVLKFILYGRSIHDTMKADDRFNALDAKLATLKTNIDTLEGNELASKLKSPTKTIPERDASWEVVKKNLRELGRDVQTMADNDPANAETIIKAANMGVKKQVVPQKKKNSAIDGPEEGEVILTGAGRGPHNWRFSKDQENWTILLASKTGRKISKGHTPDDVLYFQNSLLVDEGEDPVWSPSVRIRVKKH